MANSKYIGTENLEIMEEAKNYNDYLTHLVTQHMPKNAVVLDFGAGIGTFATKIKPHATNLICLEVDQQQANIIKNKNIEVYTELNQIPAQNINYIYALNVLEHIEDDLETLNDLYKILSIEGKILIYVPAFNSLYSNMDKKVGHFRRYDKNMLFDLIDKTKFKVKYIRYVDFVGFFASLAYILFGNKNGDVNLKSLIIYDRILFPISRVCDFFFSRWLGKNIYIVLEK